MKSKTTEIRKNIEEKLDGIKNVSYLSFIKTKNKILELPKEKGQYLFYVVDGSIRLHTPSGIMDYIEGQYFISSIDMPFCAEALTFSEKDDVIALSIDFSADEVYAVILAFEGNLAEQILNNSLNADFKEKLDKQITECFVKLTNILNEKEELQFMANQIKKEIIFYALCGSCGKQFLQSIIGTSQSSEIFDINSLIKVISKRVSQLKKLQNKAK